MYYQYATHLYKIKKIKYSHNFKMKIFYYFYSQALHMYQPCQSFKKITLNTAQINLDMLCCTGKLWHLHVMLLDPPRLGLV